MAAVLLSTRKHTADSRSTQLAFSEPLKILVGLYELRGGFSAFYNDLKNKGVPQELQPHFLGLVKTLAATITHMPTKHIGTYIYGQFYGIYKYEKGKSQRTNSIDAEYLLKNFGHFLYHSNIMKLSNRSVRL
jgi:hypothetical protein